MVTANSPTYMNSYSDIVGFVTKLNEAATDKSIPSESDDDRVQHEANTSKTIKTLVNVLQRIKDDTAQYKPEDYTGCRFGNKAHSMWLKHLHEIWDEISEELSITTTSADDALKLKLRDHFLNSFGSETRVDYGTGHEMQFVWFLKCMYDMKILQEKDLTDLVLLVMSRYFNLIRHLIDRYNLEPAGSKGAWGIDHFQFLPFMLGSAQLVSNLEVQPQQIIQQGNSSPHTDRYIFLQAIEYIKRKVKGMSLEIASPMLFGICTSCTWEKINAGLMIMFKDDISNIARIKHRC